MLLATRGAERQDSLMNEALRDTSTHHIKRQTEECKCAAIAHNN